MLIRQSSRAWTQYMSKIPSNDLVNLFAIEPITNSTFHYTKLVVRTTLLKPFHFVSIFWVYHLACFHKYNSRRLTIEIQKRINWKLFEISDTCDVLPLLEANHVKILIKTKNQVLLHGQLSLNMKAEHVPYMA